MRDGEILICDNHQDYKVPLIGTMAFNGAELWCPYCGGCFGMFGGGVRIKTTEALEGRYSIYKQYTERFLFANGRLVCAGFENDKGRNLERREFPEDLISICRAIVQKGWKHQKAMSLLKKNVPEIPSFSCIDCTGWDEKCKDFQNGVCTHWKLKNKEKYYKDNNL